MSENGSPITRYNIFIKEIDSGLYTLETADCDGSLETVITYEFCHITISTLRAAPYLVDGGDHVWAKVSAVNVYGESELSAEGNNAYYTRTPDAPIDL